MDLYKDWVFIAIENAWTSNSMALEWLQKVFIPGTQPTDSMERRLIILDGHGSHITTDSCGNAIKITSCCYICLLIRLTPFNPLI